MTILSRLLTSKRGGLPGNCGTARKCRTWRAFAYHVCSGPPPDAEAAFDVSVAWTQETSPHPVTVAHMVTGTRAFLLFGVLREKWKRTSVDYKVIWVKGREKRRRRTRRFNQKVSDIHHVRISKRSCMLQV